MRSPPGTFAGLGEVRGGESKGCGGSARRLSPASGVLSTRAAYRPSYLAQEDKRGPGVLTEGLWWPKLLRMVDVGEDRRRR